MSTMHNLSQQASRDTTIDIIIVDLGHVLFDYSTDSAPPTVPTNFFRKAFSSVAWFDYEKGRITEEECHASLAHDFGLSANDVASAIGGLQESVTMRQDVLTLLQELKPGRKIYAMSNIATPAWNFLRNKFTECTALFDHVFTSATAGERKPHLGFYRHVIHESGANPQRAVFIDDKLLNVFTARSTGMTGIVYDDFATLERSLLNLCGDSISRGQAFMRTNALKHVTYSNGGHIILDNFNALLIQEATGDPSLVEFNVPSDGHWNFTREETDLPVGIPDDVDTTSIAWTIVPHTATDELKHHVMDEMLSLRSADGIIQVYFTPSRPRVDAGICVNVLTLFHTYGRAADVQETFDWITTILETQAYVDGTYYYATADVFLFFLNRLLRVSHNARERIGTLFADRCRERVGMPGDALSLAMRAICCMEWGVDASKDVETLRMMQDIDGGWQDGWFYKYPSMGLQFANRGLTTALAVNALRVARCNLDAGGKRVSCRAR